MKFNYNGDKYEIEFSRNRRKKDTTDKGILPSRITTVRIIKTQPGKLPGELVLEATSTCAAVDNFVAETGRVKALRAACETFSSTPAFKTALWNAYITRPRPKHVQKEAKD